MPVLDLSVLTKLPSSRHVDVVCDSSLHALSETESFAAECNHILSFANWHVCILIAHSLSVCASTEVVRGVSVFVAHTKEVLIERQRKWQECVPHSIICVASDCRREADHTIGTQSKRIATVTDQELGQERVCIAKTKL